jgi:hypothetical protein
MSARRDIGAEDAIVRQSVGQRGWMRSHQLCGQWPLRYLTWYGVTSLRARQALRRPTTPPRATPATDHWSSAVIFRQA